MRISDWSSDVCSSDLTLRHDVEDLEGAVGLAHPPGDAVRLALRAVDARVDQRHVRIGAVGRYGADLEALTAVLRQERQEDRKSVVVGKECVSTCRSRGAPDP